MPNFFLFSKWHHTSHITHLTPEEVNVFLRIWGLWFALITVLLPPVFSEVILNDISDVVEDDVDIDPFSVKEEGCPFVLERHGLDIAKLNGDWKMPYASLNWIADIGMALFNHSMKMSQLTSICPTVTLSRSKVSRQSNATWTLIWKCPKLHGEFELRCWPHISNSVSKYTCWNNRENRDFLVMVAATDHENWIALVRCSPGEPGKPSEGMSWAILSKTVPLDPERVGDILSLIEGYGFDAFEYQTELSYIDCPAYKRDTLQSEGVSN
ncbi:unnamed protein product [Orchesella dallaii]|uniref:Uncharacterized protein n=1 Tax=Orchesella dallaii TaxID=48710 RepID=A0ABP1RXG8_9HEXA